ncbi:putative ribosomal L1 domain-containing protein 1-like [Cocos nucifera]|nr:putative ribosomal L1 domain-containing protein 1-like [Cocos nucifera]
MACDQIVDNVMAAIEGTMAHVPKKWANVRSVHVKAVNSVSLPIYQALPELALKIEVPVPRVSQKKDEMDQDVEEPIGEAEVVQEEEEPKKQDVEEPIGEGEEKPKMKKKTGEVMPKKGRRIHEVRYMDTDNDLDPGFEEFIISESVDEGIMEEEGGEARMEESMSKKRKRSRTKKGVEVSIGKEKKKKKGEDVIQNDKEEGSDGKERDESMVDVAKKELKNDGKVKREKDKKGRKHCSVDGEETDESYDVGKDGGVDIGSGDNEEDKVGARKKMKAAKKDATGKKGKGKRSKSDGSEDDDRNHKDDHAKESDNRMAGKKKVMKEIEENKQAKEEKVGMTKKKSKTNRLEDKEVKKIKRSKVRHDTI